MTEQVLSGPRVFPQAWHPKLQRLHGYWLSIHPTSGGLPGRQHIDPTAITDLLPHVYLLDVERDPLRFKYRLVGTDYARMMARDLTGRYLEDVHPGFDGPIRDQYVALVNSAWPAYRKGPAMYAATHRDFSVERLALPLARNGTDVDMVIGAILRS